jgi:hypothetical protein
MDYANFSISFPVILVAVPLGVVVGMVTLVLTRKKKRLLALIVGMSAGLLVSGWVLTSAFIETAKTNAMLTVADGLAVPEGFAPGKTENFRGERVVRATAFLPCMAVTAYCPSLHRQWSGPEPFEPARVDLEEVIRRSGWQGRLVIDHQHCRLTYTNSNTVSCAAEGVLGDFDTTLRLSQTRGGPWWLSLSMEPAR